MRNMWLDPNVLFYEDKIPDKDEREPSVFLAGPTSRDGIPEYMWRKDAVHFLRRFAFRGKIYIPEPRGFSYLTDKKEDDFTDSQAIYEWEHWGIHLATHLVFWIPRNLEQLLGITTNRELGQAIARAEHDTSFSKNLFIGWPDTAKKMGSMNFELKKASVGFKKGERFTSLEDLCRKLASTANMK